jgi:hypothetical protein
MIDTPGRKKQGAAQATLGFAEFLIRKFPNWR